MTGLTVIVSVTTLRNALDQTLILRAGDHPFIRHESVVFFADARIVNGARLQMLVDEYRMRTHQPCATWLIDEVEAGLKASPYTPKKVLTFISARR